MSEDVANTLLEVGNSVIRKLDADPAHSSLPKNSWQVSCSVDGSVLYFNIFLNYDFLFAEMAQELADPTLWIVDIASKAGRIALQTGKLLAGDGKRDEVVQLSESTLIFKCNQHENEDWVATCKVMDLIKVLTSKDSNFPLEARIMGLMS